MIMHFQKWVYKGMEIFFCLKLKRLSERAGKQTTFVVEKLRLESPRMLFDFQLFVCIQQGYAPLKKYTVKYVIREKRKIRTLVILIDRNYTSRKRYCSCRRATLMIKWHWSHPMTDWQWGVQNLWLHNIFITRKLSAFVI